MQMNLTQEQASHHWLCMTANYFCIIVPMTAKMKAIENDRDKYTRKRDPAESIYIKKRALRISKLLESGMDRGDAYKKMKRAGHLKYMGKTISIGRFRTICCLISKTLIIEKKETKQDAVMRLKLDGLNRKQIAEKLGCQVKYVDNAITRGRNKPAK